jgi:beta-glucosidase
MKVHNRKIWRTLASIAVCSALFVSVGGTYLNTNYSASAETSSSSDGYYPDYDSLDEAEVDARKLVEEISAEGMVLLKNKDNALPLQTAEKKVSLFGVRSEQLFYGGGGSAGGDNISPKNIRLDGALEEEGFTVNPILVDLYAKEYATGNYPDQVSERNKGTLYTDKDIGLSTEVPVSKLDASIQRSYKNYGDVAIVVIGRTGSEGGDLSRGTADGTTKHYLELNDTELALIAHLKEQKAKGVFGKIVVLVNAGTSMELGVLQDDDAIDAMLYIGMPGETGIRAAAKILDGTVNPSGKLADLFAADFTKDPTYYNFGDNSQTSGKSNYTYTVTDATDADGIDSLNYVSYEEGIYVGYRYYETRAAEYTADATWYANNVVYPYGYGLSYTSFDWTVKSVDTSAITAGIASGKLADDAKVTVKVEVKNTGSVAGKDVVELYYNAPYTEGGIEKSYVVLGAFAKTNTLKPNETQELTLEIEAIDLASYDYNDANESGASGYELDPGTYNLWLQTDSHNQKVNADASNPNSASGMTFEITGTTPITVGSHANVLSQGDKYDTTLGLTGTMTRADFKNATIASFPTAPTADDSKLTKSSLIVKTMTDKFAPGATADESDEAWYNDYVNVDTSSWKQGQDVTVKFSELVGLSKDDPKWTTFMNQMTWEEMCYFVEGCAYDSPAIDRLGIPAASYGDGPGQNYNWHVMDPGVYLPCSFLLACTWNTELAEEEGLMVGNEAFFIDVQGWFAPAVNTHRSPFAGRNFEYYGEDGLLTGNIAAAVIRGYQSKGHITFLKHFAANEQETSRDGIATWATEQSLREIYLKAFRIAVENGNPRGLMTSMNRIGAVRAATNYMALKKILRDEWGFSGYVITDMATASRATTSTNIDLIARTGNGAVLTNGRYGNMQLFNTFPLGSSGDRTNPDYENNIISGDYDATKGTVVFNGKENKITYVSVRQTVQNTLYVLAQTDILRNGVSLTSYAGATLSEASLGGSYSASVAVDPTVAKTSVLKYTLDGVSELPDGLELDEVSGTISGTPRASGEYTFDITVTADNYYTKTETFTLTVAESNTIALKTEENAASKVGAEYSAELSCGIRGYNSVPYEVVGGSLPVGLSLSADGKITGTPSVAGTYSFRVKAAICQDEGTGGGFLGGYTEPVIRDWYSTVTITIAEADAVENKDITDLNQKVTALDSTVNGIKNDVTNLSNAEPVDVTPAIVCGVIGLVLGVVAVAGVVVLFIKKKKD